MEDLLIIQKIEDMMRYGYKAVAHFPKSERHVMSQEIRLAMWRLMRGAVLQAGITFGNRAFLDGRS